jgi:hypothetical protein
LQLVLSSFFSRYIRFAFLFNILRSKQTSRLFSKNAPHIEALEKAKPSPHFQKLPPESKRKSRYRGVVITL